MEGGKSSKVGSNCTSNGIGIRTLVMSIGFIFDIHNAIWSFGAIKFIPLPFGSFHCSSQNNHGALNEVVNRGRKEVNEKNKIKGKSLL